MAENNEVKGGEFLLRKVNSREIFTPEDMDDLHLMVRNTTREFGRNRVEPRIDEIEEKAEGVAVSLLKEAGDLGLLGSDIPEEYGGDEGDKITSVVITESMSFCGSGSFSTAFSAHVGIGTLPIVFFGTHEQKNKYLPGLASGDKIAAYALTEPEAGSDALNCQARASLSEDGKYYILNGTKQFITNAAWADVIIVYAKVDGEHFTTFIVEGDYEGVSISPEEKKLGIKGSSTCSVILEDCKVPVENVLHQVGKGHQVALNILNIGRFKLGAAAAGAGKRAMEEVIDYALQRAQFKQPIARFNMIKEKIADMIIKTFAMESMCYRTAGLMDQKLEDVPEEEIPGAIREYAIEHSIAKVYCSEALDFIADEIVQIFGGYGYTQEYPAERMYRDSRINRIFEGTNEVNRMLIPGTLLPKAMKGELPFMEAVTSLKETIKKAGEKEVPSVPLEREEFILDNMKTLFLMASGNSAQVYQQELQEEQEILKRLADMASEIFAAESSLLRAKKIKENKGEEAARFPTMIAECLVYEMINKLEGWCREVLAATFDEEKASRMNQGIDTLTRHVPINIFHRKRALADEAYRSKKYFLES